MNCIYSFEIWHQRSDAEKKYVSGILTISSKPKCQGGAASMIKIVPKTIPDLFRFETVSRVHVIAKASSFKNPHLYQVSE